MVVVEFTKMSLLKFSIRCINKKKKKTTDDNTKNVNEFADEIFSHFDKDKKGLSFMEFINASLKNPTLNDVLKEEL